ncbi:MAG: hypothetical protein ACTSQ8_25045 [Candidatus Helarchaeota archaeon]
MKRKEINKMINSLEQFDLVQVVYQDHVEIFRFPLKSASEHQPLLLFAVGRFVTKTPTRILIWTSGLFDVNLALAEKGVAGRCLNHFMWIVKDTIVDIRRVKLIEEGID